MIIRVVKMTFFPEQTATFLAVFNTRKALIRHFDGCTHLELWRHATETNIYFTYSHWLSEAHLDKYRFSPLFKDTWAQTKALFAAKAEAWSVSQVAVVD